VVNYDPFNGCYCDSQLHWQQALNQIRQSDKEKERLTCADPRAIRNRNQKIVSFSVFKVAGISMSDVSCNWIFLFLPFLRLQIVIADLVDWNQNQ
jgi:hypothetical protein